MRTNTKTRRSVPLPRSLAVAFTTYVAHHVANGTPGAEHWRAARKRDGSVWLAITGPDGTEHVVSRIAGSVTEALYVLAEASA